MLPLKGLVMFNRTKLYNTFALIKHFCKRTAVVNEPVVSVGQAMPLYTQVKVPGGWKALGELKVGDLVTTPNGNYAAITGVYPQGLTDNYKFLFEDGREAESHPLHQWDVFEDKQDTPSTTTTLDILNHFSEFEYAIPLVGRLSGTTSQLSDDELVDTANKLLTGALTVEGSVEELNYTDRLTIALTMIEYQDGEHTDEGVKLSTHNDVSAYNLRDLIWSLGGVVFLTEEDGICNLIVRQRDIRNPVNLVSDTINQKTKTLGIIGIVKDNPVETLCISISSEDRLYIVENYLVTHNGDC